MAVINDLINQIENPELRDRIKQEIDRMNKQKKFGLVFEEHLPECTPLYDVPVRTGSLVALKNGDINTLYTVLKINEKKVICKKNEEIEITEFLIDELVSVSKFGDPIYPFLKPIDSICNAPDSDLWHTLIESDNYHALQLLEYLYAGKVDCIYIDPPYNTGAKDWKYNNNYVDKSDTYRHSKWLSMMQKRLKIAKKLLNPQDSVLIVTIDEKEYLHLGCLLEDLFPEAHIQMVSSVINPKGSARDGFSRSDEYIFFIMFGNCVPIMLPLSKEWSSSAIVSTKKATNTQKKEIKTEPAWTSMMRRGTDSLRMDTPNLYYPIYVDPTSKTIKKIGNAVPKGQDRAEEVPNLIQILPLRKNGSQGRWQVSNIELKNRIKQGRIRLGRPTTYGFVVNYLPDGEYAKVLQGEYIIEGYASDGSMIAYKTDGGTEELRMPPTQWKIASHNASENGTALLTSVIGEKRFPFPKSVYAVQDCLRFFNANKPNSIIVDFFAGSGTTLHAVNLLNAEDGGNRRCIMVTNNEVSDDEAKKLTKRGYHPGDPEWEKLGIAHYVTWPRTVCSIEGHDINGQPLKGNYLDSDIPMADGFEANVVFFKLSFLDKNAVALGMQFKEMLPTLWMKAGAYGQCPKLDGEEIPKVVLFPENHFAVLTEESAFPELKIQLANHQKIDTVYIITDYEAGYCAMTKSLKVKYTYQLYRDYLDNFRINTGRN